MCCRSLLLGLGGPVELVSSLQVLAELMPKLGAPLELTWVPLVELAVVLVLMFELGYHLLRHPIANQ